jgi:predicted HicB family RNase H-like nuclease
MDKEKALLDRARQLSAECETWADLSNALFDPLEGELTRAFTAGEQRVAFRQTSEYQQILEILEEKMKATGLIQGATPRKSGRFVVRLPRSLHAALEAEAKEEGTSLNQLVLAKLAVRLDSLCKKGS